MKMHSTLMWWLSKPVASALLAILVSTPWVDGSPYPLKIIPSKPPTPQSPVLSLSGRTLETVSRETSSSVSSGQHKASSLTTCPGTLTGESACHLQRRLMSPSSTITRLTVQTGQETVSTSSANLHHAAKSGLFQGIRERREHRRERRTIRRKLLCLLLCR